MKQHERRSITARATTQDGNKLVGYAAVWDSPTTIREGGKTFTEVVRRGAFKEAIRLNTDVVCCFNHDPNRLLGRTASGTLTIREDETGLRFECDLPDTSTGNEVRTLAERGDITGASFAFQVRKDKWDGSTRELLDCKLFDVSPVTTPAYPDTNGTVGVRSNMGMAKAKLLLAENEI